MLEFHVSCKNSNNWISIQNIGKIANSELQTHSKKKVAKRVVCAYSEEKNYRGSILNEDTE